MNAPIGIAWSDSNAFFLRANESFCRILGYSENELQKLTFKEITYPNDLNKSISKMEELVSGRISFFSEEKRYMRKDGTIIYGKVMVSVIRNEAGEPTLFVSELEDITQNKKAERAFEESEEKYKNLFENAPDVIVTIDLTGKITSANRALMQHGFKENEIVGNSIFKLVPIEYTQKMLIGLKNIGAGKPAHGEIDILTPNGRRNTEYNSNPIWKNSKVIGYQTVIRDVTERKKAEREILEQKIRAERYLNIVGNIILALDFNGKITLLNKKGYEILGYEEGSLEGREWFDTCLPNEIKEDVRKTFEDLIQGKTKNREHFVNLVVTKSGEMRIVSWHNTVLRDESGKIIGTLSSGDNITERKKAEKALRESEEKHRKLFEESKDAIFVADATTGTIVDCNSAASRLVGREKSELVGQHQSIIHPKEQKEGEFTGGFKYHVKDQNKTLETQIMMKTGEIRDVAVNGTIFELNGKKLIQGTFRDITDSKKAEQSIKETEERYHKLVEDLPEIIFEADLTGKLTFFNQTAFKTTGYNREEFRKGLNMLHFVVPEQREQAVENIKKTLTEGAGEPHEYTLVRRDGTTYPVLVKTTAIISGNNVTGIRGFLFDITERNKNDQILKASEEKFRNLAENSPNMIFIYQKGKVVYANKEAEKAMGYTTEEYYSSEFNFLDLIVPEHRDLVVSNFAKHTKGEDTSPYEYGLMTKNGNRIDAILNTKIITYNGEPAILGIVTDITERKLMQRSLEESEEKFRTITNSVRDAIIMFDNEARIAFLESSCRENVWLPKNRSNWQKNP